MIAQDFARARVLASGSIAVPYGVASTVRARGQKCPTGGAFGPARGPTPPCEGAAALSVRLSPAPGTMLEMGK